ncbi:single-stranded DNA-binding protein [Candidatus Mycoplasma mahonii]|uniref:single-stranded DNA-binding protein n=1 Tax=Candidatus Mycoplasma mahonii TaxID=3004105 RepID=UPI0026F2787E|nr:single-stranded DNA-binding protein [Candidatus Mycoplasma mahonii]WKX02705.1 single-stranded DNA-binding protein [Candidatus Mycoplasma mahonii]
MNKILLVGRFVRNPETNLTSSNIKYTRFTVAVTRPFGENQADFIPIVAWRSQADFVDKYMVKGSLVSVEGRFTSNTYKNNENMNVTRYEVTADRIEGLESKEQQKARIGRSDKVTEFKTSDEKFTEQIPSATDTKVMNFEKESNVEKREENEVPWELDL